MSRTKEFDEDLVIEKAMHLFWQKGYHATSLNDLVKETGLHRGSIYGTFKNKNQLFLKSLSKYYESRLAKIIITDDSSGKELLYNFFKNIVTEAYTGKAKKGCLIMNSQIELCHEDSETSELVESYFNKVELKIQQMVKLGIKKKEFSSDIKVKSIVSRLFAAAFAIRELSKFKRDKEFYTSIANGVLKDLEIKV